MVWICGLGWGSLLLKPQDELVGQLVGLAISLWIILVCSLLVRTSRLEDWVHSVVHALLLTGSCLVSCVTHVLVHIGCVRALERMLTAQIRCPIAVFSLRLFVVFLPLLLLLLCRLSLVV